MPSAHLRVTPPSPPTPGRSSLRPRLTSTAPGSISPTNRRRLPTTGPTAPDRPARPRGTGSPSSPRSLAPTDCPSWPRLFARVGIAVHDAFIECWYTKYVYNLQRPVTYINKHIDPAWRSYLTTPPFPSYDSGHSAQSGAASTVLTDMFGNTPFTDTIHTDHGLVPPLPPRTFASFEAAANEAAISRFYGGIHYPFDNNDGLGSGQCIGDLIRERVQFKK
ncbi:MAG: hypothetical protein DMG06_18740 [Acidobacteria bacterium]|nr:MAG: hypothetical protein DMG06_18740 [Acidobacteriota bacterium]